MPKEVQVFEGGNGEEVFLGWAPTAVCICCYDLVPMGEKLCERCQHQYKNCSDCDRGADVDGTLCRTCNGQAYIAKEVNG